MLIKFIGAGMIVAGSGGCGALMAREYIWEEKCLGQFQRMVSSMAERLRSRRSSLPELFSFSAELAGGVIGDVASDMAKELQRQVTPDAPSCLAIVMKRHTLPPQTAQLMEELGKGLGVFDLQGQLQELETVGEKCGSLMEKMAVERGSRVRLLRTMGLCAGAAVAVLLM